MNINREKTKKEVLYQGRPKSLIFPSHSKLVKVEIIKDLVNKGKVKSKFPSQKLKRLFKLLHIL